MKGNTFMKVDDLLDKCAGIERFVIEDDNDFERQYYYDDYVSGIIPQELLDLKIDYISVDRNELIINLGRCDSDHLASFNDSIERKRNPYKGRKYIKRLTHHSFYNN